MIQDEMVSDVVLVFKYSDCVLVDRYFWIFGVFLGFTRGGRISDKGLYT